MKKTIAISINTSWNIVNFRSGLIRALIAAGHRVVAISPSDSFVPALTAMGVEHIPITIDSKGLSPFRDLALLREYRSILQQLRPDIFLGYTAKPNIWGTLAATSLGIRVINNISGLGTAFIRSGWLNKVVSALYKVALRGSATVFFQNREDRDLFVGRKLVDPGKASLLPGSGIDLSAFRPLPAPENPVPVFLLVARLLRDKGVADYVEAARLLKSERPALGFRLLGGLTSSNRSAISSAELNSWIAEGVIEHIDQTDDVRPHIAAADCVVLPSYREGLPRSLLEGAALSRPLVATDVPGCRDIARSGVNAFLCEPANPVSLASAMRQMADLTSATRIAMGIASRRIVEDEFDERIVVERYLKAIAAV